MVICRCGDAATLPQTGAARCGIDFGMINIMAYVKMDDLPTVGETTPTALALLTNIVDKSNWVEAITAGKVSMSPMVTSPTGTSGEPITWGGGDVSETEEVLDYENYGFECDFPHIRPAVAKAIDELRCLAQQKNLGVYFFTTKGYIIGKSGSTTASGDSCMPINVDSLSLGDRAFGNKTAPDLHHLNMGLPAGWTFDIQEAIMSKVGGNDQTWRGLDLLGQGNE